MRLLSRLPFLLVAVVALQGCAKTSAGPSSFYVEPSIPRSQLGFRRVAVVPNRLPMNLQDPERWRKFNYELTANEFRKRGFTVLDYAAATQVFNEGGLPLEDTRSSRDKYSELGRQMGVDLIVVPYYGTFATTSGSILSQEFQYTGVATYQFFDVRSNQFIGRTDLTGTDEYSTYTMYMFLLGQINAMGQEDPEDKAAAQQLAGIMGLVGLVADLYNGSKSPTWRFERAFRTGIPKGLEGFFAQFPAPSTPTPVAGKGK